MQICTKRLSTYSCTSSVLRFRRLALRESNGDYIVNGNQALGYTNTYPGAGTSFRYRRPTPTDGAGVHESVFADGPTNVAVDIMVSRVQSVHASENQFQIIRYRLPQLKRVLRWVQQTIGYYSAYGNAIFENDIDLFTFFVLLLFQLDVAKGDCGVKKLKLVNFKIARSRFMLPTVPGR